MKTFRFRSKIIALLVLLVLGAQAATFAVVQVVTERSVRAELEDRLRAAERIWQRFHEVRGTRVRDSVMLLADDFGFRAAVASGDEPTMLSALANQSVRLNADLGALLRPDGTLQSSLSTAAAEQQQAALAPLLDRARTDGSAVAVVALDDVLYQVALVPVMAPTLVGWVALGSRLNAQYTVVYRDLTGFDVSLARVEGERLRVYASSLDPQSAALLAQQTQLTRDLGALREVRLQSARAFVVTQQVTAAPLPVVAVLQGSLDTAMAPYAALKRRILVLSGLAALLALIVAVLLARSVSRPVGELAEAALRIEHGDYSRLPRMRGKDELARLGSAFARMQEGIAEREAKIVFQATHDALTGLPNRARAVEALESAIRRCQREGGGCAVVMLDLDRFKEINDTLGHAFGDRVLVEAARRLRDATLPGDLVARLGGDEFFVLLDNADPQRVRERAADVLAQLRRPLELPDTRIHLDASLGVALHPQHGADAQTLLRRADIALYEGKQQRSGVALYRDGSDEIHLRRLTLLADLPRAIERNQFDLHFQPKLELEHGRVVHAEALLRWTHPVLGAIGPDEFVPLAEHSGFIHAMTRHVLDRALLHNGLWREQDLDLGIAVNLSAMDLMDVDLVDFIDQALRRHAVPPGRLILELTESALMRDVDYAVRMLHRLRGVGVRLSIDDFGTGYSSLAQLKRLPVDELKIDKSFVMQLSEGSDDAVIVRSTIELGHNMGLSVIAEGVEDDRSLALLRRFNCDMVQGFLFSAPMPGEELLGWHARFVAAPREA
ncbi:putative bifunctional diguanylate cyclase/phosphodiesterase [Chiayiivirga flava]|uniref:putative bifunctional diguanylate cyclase/phosphodiesterase n=1 Tax=Chiayiivirga flava TaxID=659595 RepID=UPI001FEC0F9B|nr:GGDEF domain-containing protein [Chiayiivirga flava]